MKEGTYNAAARTRRVPWVGRETPHAPVADAPSTAMTSLYVPSVFDDALSATSPSDWCDVVRKQSKNKKVKHSLALASRMRGPSADQGWRNDSQLFGHLGLGECSAPIEPLWGTGRHPMAASYLCNTTAIHNNNAPYQLDPRHLILSNHCGLNEGKRAGCRKAGRNLYFDLGSAEYSGNLGSDHRYSVTLAKRLNISIEEAKAQRERERIENPPQSIRAIGPTITIFRRLFKYNCIEFDHVYAWEKHLYPKWWDRVPEAEKPHVTFYNEPVNMSDASALGVLARTARPEDFVVFKLDIDYPPLEREIIDAFLNRPELAALVDELFFEYPLGQDDGLGSGPRASRGAQEFGEAAKAAVGVMTRLRRLGIRAHFWI
jgi:hypothetical protein